MNFSSEERLIYHRFVMDQSAPRNDPPGGMYLFSLGFGSHLGWRPVRRLLG
jgi:hypothetical protein